MTLPDWEDIRDIWKGAQDSPKWRELMTWYMDVYLAATIGSTYWGPQERREHLLVSTMTLPKIKKTRVRIHTVTEAHAMFQCESCWRAWWKIFDLKHTGWLERSS